MFNKTGKYITPVILAGGLGTRLRSVVGNCPKVMAPVNGRPFLTILFDQLLEAGFKEVILCTSYRADFLKETLGFSYNKLKIRYSYEQKPLGTGGALRNALHTVNTESILLMNGDSYINIDISFFINWYLENGHKAALVLTKVLDATRYGTVKINFKGQVISFEEKNQNAKQGFINAGVYIFDKSLLLSIPCGQAFSLEREFLQTLTKRLYGFQCQGAFIDIGTPDSYSKAQSFFGSDKIVNSPHSGIE